MEENNNAACGFRDMGCYYSINRDNRKKTESHETACPATPDRHNSIPVQFDEESERTSSRERTGAKDEDRSAVNVYQRRSRSSIKKLVLEVMDVLRMLTEKSVITDVFIRCILHYRVILHYSYLNSEDLNNKYYK